MGLNLCGCENISNPSPETNLVINNNIIILIIYFSSKIEPH